MKHFFLCSVYSLVNGNGRKILFKCSDPVSKLTLSGYSLVLIESLVISVGRGEKCFALNILWSGADCFKCSKIRHLF